MSDERQAFEQLHAIPSGVEWCEKRHIYIHKNYSGLVLHPINESWEAFCEGALWQASREEGEPIGEVGYMIQPNWDDPSKTKGVALVDKSLAPGTKLYTHPASRQAVSVPEWTDINLMQPEEYQDVLWFCQGGSIRTGMYYGKNHCDRVPETHPISRRGRSHYGKFGRYADPAESGHVVTHWMPLPCPPKQEQSNGRNH